MYLVDLRLVFDKHFVYKFTKLYLCLKLPQGVARNYPVGAKHNITGT